MVPPHITSLEDDSNPSATYLEPGESIVILDDSPEVVLIFENLLKTEGFSVLSASNASQLYEILEREQVALLLLDIGLPDCDGTELLQEISPKYPDLSIIMLTGTTDLNVALTCLRRGADDYLAKPVGLGEFTLAVRRSLIKRRLIIENHRYQKQLEQTTFRTQFLHQLNLKMNSAYLSSIELNSVLQSVLVGITAEEGLKFNRAFLLLFTHDHNELQGTMAIGPPRRSDANRVWQEIKENNLHLTDILHKVNSSPMNKETDAELNNIIKRLVVPAQKGDHVLIHACNTRNSIHVKAGMYGNAQVSSHLMEQLSEDTFIVTPLFSPNKSLGVIIADNFVTGHPISEEDINSLEIFAGQASLAIEHSHLYKEMQDKITELEDVTQELEKNKNLLIDSERYSALGHMSAQLVHAIRNPITSIGGIARLLARKSPDDKSRKFFDMMIQESTKIEATLNDLFSFVGEDDTEKKSHPLYPMIRKSIMLFYGTMKKQSILYQLNLPTPDPELHVDSKQIRQMLLHLIRNGVEAMPSGGLLTVSCEMREENVYISIEDSGNGIGIGNMERVTDPFFTTKTYGTGMGLTLVEKIVAEHQGQFSLEHGETGGMVAHIVLPMGRAESS
jgi:signal transduction histidine kinase/DNA-binding response OmpR family regulator